jgi:lipopolysaccharide heptosyltransferase I
MPPANTTEFKNILIIKPSAAGDIVCALPILSALRDKYPSARISWLVNSTLAGLLRGHPMIDELIEFDRRRYGYLAHSWAVTKRFMDFLRNLRTARYDLVLDLQGLFRSGFLAWTTQSPVRIGPAERREMGWVFYTHRCPPRPTDTHIVDRIATAGELLGLDFSEPRFCLPIRQEARDRTAELLKSVGLDGAEKYLAIAPGGTWLSKRWPAENFAELARKVTAELDLPVVVVGGRAERRLGEQMVESLADRRIVSLAGRTDLPELLAVLEGACGLVCNDSGPMHMAVALNRPVTAIIGPTNDRRTGPYHRPESVVKSGIDCSPCYKRRCMRVAEGSLPLCMAQIRVEEVFNNLAARLATCA